MKREEIEVVLENIRCKGFAFHLELAIVEKKSILMKYMVELDIETRDKVYEEIYKNSCFYFLYVSSLGYDAGIDRPAMMFDKYWLITPEMEESEIIKLAFEAVLNANQTMIKEEFTYCDFHCFSFNVNLESLTRAMNDDKLIRKLDIKDGIIVAREGTNG
jgi:hypothetical protein